jgi:hypothetical protein
MYRVRMDGMGWDGVTEHTTVPPGMVHHHRSGQEAGGWEFMARAGRWAALVFRFSELWFQVGERDTANRSSWERLFCFVLYCCIFRRIEI